MTVVRLKKAYWLDSVHLVPRIEAAEREQNAYFSNEYTPDLMLKSVQEIIDVNDISTINSVYTDVTTMQAALHLPDIDRKAVFERYLRDIVISETEDEAR